MNDRILVVDDNPKNLQVIAALLSENDYSVEVALSGSNALKWLEDTAFDAILLDIMMPEMNGFETCKIIKQNAEHVNVPVIFLTARHDIESFTEGFEIGGVDFITKPFNQKELLIRLNTHIELKKSREKLIDVNAWLKLEVEKKTIELTESNQRLKEANENLKLLDIAKNDFLNSISHELRTPLNGIVGSINLLKSLTHDDYVQEIVSLLDSSVNNLEKYSYAALQISNLQLKGNSQLRLKQVDLLQTIRSIMLDFSEKAKAKGLETSITNNCTEAIVSVDESLIIDAISSLLESSLIFTRDGYINVEVASGSNQIVVRIEDSGSTYDGKELEHFFKSVSTQNYTFQRNNAMELYLAKMIILLHKGKVEFKNIKDNKGAVTEFSLPL